MSKRAIANPRQRLHNLPRIDRWPKNDVYLVGDSMLYNIEAGHLSTKKSFVRVRYFPGATLEDMEDYIRSLARKQPSHMIIHCGTNDLTSTK